MLVVTLTVSTPWWSHIFTVTAPVSLTDWLLQDKWHFGSISLWEAEQILAGDDQAAISSWSSASHCTHTTHQISQEGFPVPRAKDTVTFIHFYKECFWKIETENISPSHDKLVNSKMLILIFSVNFDPIRSPKSKNDLSIWI